MKYYLNAIDLEKKFGIIITNGTNVMMMFPNLKPTTTTDYKGKNGVDKDLSDKKFEARTFVFNGVIEAADPDTLQKNWWAFFGMLKKNGKYTWYNDYLNAMLFVYYDRLTALSDMYQSAGGIAMTFSIQFGETDPFDNVPEIVLVNEALEVLVP